MAQCKQTAEEFITNAFSPMVAVLCSADAEKLCQKNNLSFVQLIQPFCRLSTEAHIRDPGGIPHVVKSLRIIVKDMQQSLYQPTMAKRLMNETVSGACPSNMDNTKGTVLTVGDYDLQISSTTPWFEVYRDCFLEVAYPSDHEFLKHFLSCMFIVSSSNPDPMDQFAKLSQQQHQQQHQSPTKPPKWFSPNTFKYFVLVHDVAEGEESKADAVYQSMKSMYGAGSCHLLQINSRSVSSKENLNNEPDPWSQFMPKNDAESLDIEASLFSKNDSSFPSRVTEGEGTLRMETVIEDATEVKEEPSMQKSASAPVMSHPLDDNTVDGGWSETADRGQQQQQDSTDGTPADPSAQSKGIPNQTQAKARPVVNGDVGASSQHGLCLTPSDHDRLKIFIHEFLVRGLIPWAERMIRTLNDQVSSRKRSLFSGAKKWFGGYKPNDKPTNNTTVVYTPEAPEMQTRRLADLAFMFQLYEIAYQTYHALKRDFNNDHAWLHHAGALEMASLAVFMQGSQTQRQYPAHYIESAIASYLNTCKSPQFATRATLMSTEALKSRGMYAEAAMQFIKMTSEDSDLRSALMLEQAGHCFINMKLPMVRKYAFHMILAGHRFNKAGQRRHALRAYSQALQVYKGKDWILAEDHINFTVGRQSFNLKQLDNAASALRHLLCRSSQQTPAQQGAFLKEYLFVFKQHLQQGSSVDGLPQLPLPSVNGNTAKVLLCQPGQCPQGNKTPATGVGFIDDGRSLSWMELEQKVAATASGKPGKVPANFKPSVQCFSDLTNNSSHPVAVIGEPIFVEITLVNPLKISLVLTDIVLLWSFLPHVDEEQNQEKPPQLITNEHVETGKKTLANELVESEVIPELVLEALMTEPLQLSVIPKKEGELHITGIAYNLGTSSSSTNTTSATSGNVIGNPGEQKPSFISGISVRGKQVIEVQGPRLNASKVEKCSKIYGPDRRLDVRIVPKMPLLEVNLYGVPQTMMCGEVQQLTVEFINRGPLPLHKLYMACSHPKFCTFGSSDTLPQASALYQYNSQQTGSAVHNELHVVKELWAEDAQQVPLKRDILDPGGVVSVPLWIRGLDINGVHNVDFLFYYEPVDRKCPLMRHRVVRHTAVMRTSNALKLTSTAQKLPPSKRGQLNSLVLALEAEKVFDASVLEVSLLQVSCASPTWTLHHLSTRPHTDMKLSATESLLMSFKATRCQDCAAVSSSKLIFSDVTFDQHQISSTGSPCCDFCFKSRQTWKLASSSSEGDPSVPQTTPTPPSQDQGLEDLAHIDLSLIVLWKFKVVTESGAIGTIQGQHHLHIDSLDTPAYSPAVSKVPVEHAPVKIIKDRAPSLPSHPNPELVSQLLKICLRHNMTVLHNFHKNRLCYMPVSIVLHNTSQNTVKVDMSSREPSSHRSHAESTTSDIILEPTSSGFSWSGKIHSTLQLQPLETHTLHLVACFNSPGVYNLNRLQVAAGVLRESSDLDIDMVVQKHPAPSVAIVKQEPLTSS
ncbi:trafficking protein particle complex subunit 8-like isoform X2 [Lingula anatina]|uniref:Trafficking protein particle complex subunit 8-like isoform X2 n=1 Tax=Lingula anatina TaxID=7574 RepID=A0A1S3HB40_LINAN|nr:trafficking protein particle complex subunit 8-like isoform X2 [Lingula anatina]|eukprot:XP_013382686.1 trafficking protein particle complex subunit 8-like isoform X2 [Lingula anatina]